MEHRLHDLHINFLLICFMVEVMPPHVQGTTESLTITFTWVHGSSFLWLWILKYIIHSQNGENL